MASATLRDDLYLEYLFCPTSGQVVPDTSGNGRHGVMGLTIDEEIAGISSSPDPAGGFQTYSDPEWVYNGIHLVPDSGDIWDRKIVEGPNVTGVEDAYYGLDHWAATLSPEVYADGITMEVWVQLGAIGTGLTHALCFIGDGNTNQSLYVTNYGTGTHPHSEPAGYYLEYLGSYISDAEDGEDGLVEAWVVTDTPLDLDAWMHIVSVRDGESTQLYLNGTLLVDKRLSVYENGDYPIIGTSPITIGVMDNGDPIRLTIGSLHGYIGEARIYSAALTAEQVLSNYTLSNYYPDGKNVCGIARNRYYAF